MEMDHKQQRLISGWKAQAKQSQDPYFCFMSLWIAFNASCYALYHASANRQRADLKKFERKLTEDGYLEVRVFLKGNELEINADKLQISLTIVEKYTEDRIFSKFASVVQRRYGAALDTDEEFRKSVDFFRQAIRKPNGYYVVNLSKGNLTQIDSWSEAEVKENTNFLKSFHDEKKLSLLKDALYQVRCNVFHGEKVPGDINDDRIVKSALPVLEKLLEFALDA